MTQYAWICLNAEYDWICQYTPEKNSAEYARYSQNYILKGNLAQWWKQSGHFSQESGNIDQNTSCAHLWVWLNMDQYPWICVIIIENAWINCSDCCKCQSSEYTWLSYMFDRLLKMPQILNKPEFQICLIMTSYASIMPEGTSI